MRDQRDTKTWVVVELSRAGELRAEEGTLTKGLSDAMHRSDLSVFVPAVTYSKGDTKVTVFLMEGYAFIESGLPDVEYFKLETSCPLVHGVLTSKLPNGMRVLSTVPDTNIQQLRVQLRDRVASDISPDMTVRIIAGPYTALVGQVVGVDDENAFVHIGPPLLRSINILVSLPKLFLDPEDLVAGGDLQPVLSDGQLLDMSVSNTTEVVSDVLKPLLLALGSTSDFQADRPIPMKTVLAQTYTLMGVTDQVVADRKFQQELARKIGFAFRNKRAEYCKKSPPLTIQTKRGYWALTDSGVQMAKSLSR